MHLEPVAEQRVNCRSESPAATVGLEKSLLPWAALYVAVDSTSVPLCTASYRWIRRPKC